MFIVKQIASSPSGHIYPSISQCQSLLIPFASPSSTSQVRLMSLTRALVLILLAPPLVSGNQKGTQKGNQKGTQELKAVDSEIFS